MSSDNNALLTEDDKLEIELIHDELYGLRFQMYKYWLDIQYVVFSTDHLKANVVLFENHDVIFTITAPTVSKMRNLEHKISLINIDGNWLISEDKYEDYLWSLLNKSKLSKQEFITTMNEGYQYFLSDKEPNKQPIVDNSVKSRGYYDRIGARDYAATYWETYNPYYYNFNSNDGDCANFVSQVMHEGGGIPETDDSQPTYGWYYNSSQDYASAWTGVPYMYDFLLNGAYWNGGPEATLKNPSSLYIGDVIIFDLKSAGGTYDHATVVSSMVDMGNGTYFPLVAAHNNNCYDYPFTSFQYYQTYAFQITGY
jgi:hypothetical protein